MNLQELRTYLDRLALNLEREDKRLLEARLEGLTSVFPFNEYEYILTFLVDRRVIPFAEYEKLRNNYVSANRYLDLFGLAPRIFGQVWGETHLQPVKEAATWRRTVVLPTPGAPVSKRTCSIGMAFSQT